MALDKESVIIVGIFFALSILGLGLMGVGVDLGTWYPLMAGLFTGFVLISQIGVKVLWSLHRITSLTWMQYITLGIASLNFLNAGISLLPLENAGILLLPLEIELLSKASAGVLLIVSAVWFIVELFSQRA